MQLMAIFAPDSRRTNPLLAKMAGEEPASRESFHTHSNMKKPGLAHFFVFVQLSCLALIAVTGPLFADSIWGLLTEVAGVLLAIVAIMQMKPGKVNLLPLPRADGKLVTEGVYKYIRHPMYIAQIVAVAPLVIESPDLLRVAALLLLIIDLIFKLHYEERKLIQHFDGYKEYMKRTWRFIPNLW